jgi:hypothetical protein
MSCLSGSLSVHMFALRSSWQDVGGIWYWQHMRNVVSEFNFCSSRSNRKLTFHYRQIKHYRLSYKRLTVPKVVNDAKYSSHKDCQLLFLPLLFASRYVTSSRRLHKNYVLNNQIKQARVSGFVYCYYTVPQYFSIIRFKINNHRVLKMKVNVKINLYQNESSW